MKIKRYYAKDMRQAIREIREDQGPDAVILSTRNVDGGIEIIAAVDYDESIFSEMSGPAPARGKAAPQGQGRPAVAETAGAAAPAPVETQAQVPARSQGTATRTRPAAKWMQDPAIVEMRNEISSLRGILESRLTHLAWNDMARNQPERAGILHRLAELGLSPELSQQIAAQVQVTQEGLEHAWRQAMAILAHQLLVSEDDILNKGGIVALIGATGVGKTTTIAKLAARFALRHGQHEVALISTDHYRIGAHEQLMTFGRILGVPTYAVEGKEQLVKTINDLGDKRLVLIDTAGAGQRDLRLNEQLSRLRIDTHQIRNYLVMSANTQRSSLDEVIRSFQRVPLAGCILTKLDETSSLGGALSAVIEHHLPVSYISDGQRVPEDIYPARAHSLVSRAVASMQQAERGAAGLDPAHPEGEAVHAHA